MLNGMVCRLRGHAINRNRVWHDNLNFRTTCQTCGAALLRTGEGWRLFDSKKDPDPERRPHPNFARAKAKRSKRLVG